MTEGIDLPDPGPNRYWHGVHRPLSRKTPLRLELRERTNRNSNRLVTSMSRLIGYEDTTAGIEALAEAAEKILERAARVDEFVGVLKMGEQG